MPSLQARWEWFCLWFVELANGSRRLRAYPWRLETDATAVAGFARRMGRAMKGTQPVVKRRSPPPWMLACWLRGDHFREVRVHVTDGTNAEFRHQDFEDRRGQERR